MRVDVAKEEVQYTYTYSVNGNVAVYMHTYLHYLTKKSYRVCELCAGIQLDYRHQCHHSTNDLESTTVSCIQRIVQVFLPITIVPQYPISTLVCSLNLHTHTQTSELGYPYKETVYSTRMYTLPTSAIIINIVLCVL